MLQMIKVCTKHAAIQNYCAIIAECIAATMISLQGLAATVISPECSATSIICPECNATCAGWAYHHVIYGLDGDVQEGEGCANHRNDARSVHKARPGNVKA